MQRSCGRTRLVTYDISGKRMVIHAEKSKIVFRSI